MEAKVCFGNRLLKVWARPVGAWAIGFFLSTVVELELKGQGWRGYSTASTAKVK